MRAGLGCLGDRRVGLTIQCTHVRAARWVRGRGERWRTEITAERDGVRGSGTDQGGEAPESNRTLGRLCLYRRPGATKRRFREVRVKVCDLASLPALVGGSGTSLRELGRMLCERDLEPA